MDHLGSCEIGRLDRFLGATKLFNLIDSLFLVSLACGAPGPHGVFADAVQNPRSASSDVHELDAGHMITAESPPLYVCRT